MHITTFIDTSLALGVGATLVMDGWTLLLKRLGVRTLDYALLGRWLGHLGRGRWRHAAIGKAPPIAWERALGWFAHYAIGIVFAAVFTLWAGAPWLAAPTLLPALGFALATVLLPLLVMQPAMGAGVFARRTPAPARGCLRSLATHGVFGLGLYGAGWARALMG
ncbi:DUF2938 domain-containing protein [Pseudomonas sp.]|uniref:DUF2938 domain-containing protein n=1 Tax=Pseudomonas sp. TaxID=306 RepID=UPI0028A5F5DC|nr:DUF2938 domain-containing protein [Pseudomonas sp.]